MLATLGKTAARALVQRVRGGQSAHAGTLVTPGPELRRTFAPLDSNLLDQYIAHVGGDPRAYRGVVPPHFFPHWAMPLGADALAGLPYPILRVLNAGCRMQVNALMPRNEALHVRAQLANVDDDGKRALITTRVITGTDSAPDALHVEIYAFVPLSSDKPRSANGQPAAAPKRDKPRVPQGCREIAFGKLPADAGLSFAKLTGDFNPIHWVPLWARAAGFPAPILHGFATLARAFEALVSARLGGDPGRLRAIDVRFVKPLVLPARVVVCASDEGSVWVGDAPGGAAYLEGTIEG